MMSKTTEDFLRAWSMPQVAILHTLALEMESYGLTAAEVVKICAKKLETGRTGPQHRSPARSMPRRPRCPECQNDSVEVTPVNVSRCTNIGGNWRTSIVCHNPQCRFTELSKKSMDEWCYFLGSN